MGERPSVLVTGVGKSSGLGFEICRQMMALDYRVILSARSRSSAERLSKELDTDGDKVVPLELDIADSLSVARAVSFVESSGEGLTCLINNAAAVTDYSETASTANLEAARAVLDTTVLGTWRVTQAMIPFLRRSKHPRIVFVTSGAGSHGDPQFGLSSKNSMGPSYGIAKAALNALTSVFAKELRDSGVIVNAVCPGLTATFPGAEAMGARPVSEGAKGIVWAATLPSDGPTGGFFRDGRPLPW